LSPNANLSRKTGGPSLATSTVKEEKQLFSSFYFSSLSLSEDFTVSQRTQVFVTAAKKRITKMLLWNLLLLAFFPDTKKKFLPRAEAQPSYVSSYT
jgi:hypothetical protein